MSVRSLSCPKCQTKINVPAAMQTARCPACGNVFSVASAVSANSANPATGPSQEEALRKTPETQDESTDKKSDDATMIYVASGGAVTMLVLFGVIGYLLISPSNDDLKKQNNETQKSQPVFQEPTPEEIAALTIVNIPEERRRRIYDDMRRTATMTTEKPLMVPGSAVRDKLEGMLEATYENSIQQLAALHDLTTEDIRNIVKEGDLKNWDPRARSRAYRDGERVYDDAKTEGYQAKKPI